MSEPVGIFDSGFGGLTVVRRFLTMLPEESIAYFGDNARVPYGSRTQEEIQAFVLEVAEFLVGQGVKALVVACNTATAAALPALQGAFSLPVVGIIEPGAREAALASHTGEIAVIGTEFTISSGSYQRAIKKYNPRAKVYGQACPLFVPFVEMGKLSGPEVEAAAGEYLSFLANTAVDTLVLGCTHYPHLLRVIRKVIGPDIKIVDPAVATVVTLREILRERGLLAPAGTVPKHRFYTSADPEHFRRLGQQLLGFPMEHVEQVPVRK
ncbi:MAG: glutamate racemase [bacterium]|jgi:glutamate racemase|nr:glutamate racemase [Bacillota bacterium]HHW54393.1 glutamate racemase [Bacillota bacterium]